ncbi:MAG TPA: Holliday junction resolvase RuvX [Steroidobacteraceae bacterium]|nr:Holliday junction resolvase RuvX [Steroidobacteraceae bacterium]
MPDEAAAVTAGRRHQEKLLAVAFDFGLKRIGVACGGTVSGTATPLAGICVGATGPRWEAIDSLMREWQPTVLVVGMPYHVDGSESRAAARARSFAAELRRRYALPVELIDERYSSLEAEARLKHERESGLRRRRVAKADVDAASACVILERWLQHLGEHRTSEHSARASDQNLDELK